MSETTAAPNAVGQANVQRQEKARKTMLSRQGTSPEEMHKQLLAYNASQPERKASETLSPMRRRNFEHSNTAHMVTVEAGTQPEMLLAPEFWANVAPQFKQYDRVNVTIDDGSYYADLLVLEAARNYLKLKPLIFVQLEEVDQGAAEEAITGYTLKHRGPILRWCVIRDSDSQVLREKCSSRGEAQSWLTQHVRAQR